VTRPALTLSLVILGTWIVLAGAAWAAFGVALKAPSLAAVVNWLPGVWTLGLIHKSRASAPTVQIAILMGSSFIRLGLAVVGGGLGWYLISDLHGRELALVIWGGVFYVVTLVAETTLAYRMVASQGGS
jgi:hypothetical protein